MSLNLEVKPRSDNLEKAIALVCFISRPSTFQNLIIFQILSVFSSRLRHTTYLMWVQTWFSNVFGTLKFGPKMTILQRFMALAKFPF